jgi:peptidoglycan hydrolase-like protein with peptidoglycan-binding domain
LGGSSITNANINSGGVFSWIPTNGDAGVHNLTITATDQGGNSASATEQITVKGVPTISIQSLSPSSTVNVGQTVFFATLATSFTNPIYSVSDSAVSSSLSASNINSSGNFSWTPENQDVGNHTLTVTATDSLGDTANITQPITVSPIATATIQSLVPGSTISSGQNVTFNVTPTGFTNPTYSVSDSFYGNASSNASVNSSGVFNWTPSMSDIGTHTFTINISDTNGDTATITQTIVVQSAGMSIQSLLPGAVVLYNTPVSFTASTTGFTNPVYSVSDSFSGGSITNSNINSSGFFTWVPLPNDVGSHYISIYASDSSGHTATSNVTITVTSNGSVPVTTSQTSTNTSTSGYTFSSYLSLGSTGNDVTELQKILIQKGFLSATATGYFGSLTENAVKQFQTSNGLSAVGFVGPGTRAVLNQIESSGTATNTTTASSTTGYVFSLPLSVGSTGADVTALQNRLTQDGFYSGPITGYFGSLTQAGVERFQSAHGLSQIGSVGPGTRAALNN